MPLLGSVQFVDAGSLGAGALGAYDSANGGTLYLDRSLLNGEPAKLQSVFNEEMGHHLDAVLGGADAAGDEGAVFAQTLEQGPLDQNTLSLLRSENDHGLILVEGRLIEVEFRNENEGSGDGHGGAGGSGSADSGQCSVDSGAGSSGTTDSKSTDDEGGDTDSGDTPGECSIGGDTNNPPAADKPKQTDTTPRDWGNRDEVKPTSRNTPPAEDNPESNTQPPDDDTRSEDRGVKSSDLLDLAMTPLSDPMDDRETDEKESELTAEVSDYLNPEALVPADEQDIADNKGGLFGNGGLFGLGLSDDVFVGVEVDLIGAFGVEFGFGVVVDLDTPTDSGIFGNGGLAGGANVGVVVGGGYATGDIEGVSAGVDVNMPGFSIQSSIGEDGGGVVGGSLGFGIGASVNQTYTSTYAPFRRE